ncbi:MAG TPA: sugar phosphate isomerase/epimerase, partial [Firmicutes bacterium]|nr:sugar phosphate isomerase/epimerase [Bacillota bacterium]
MNKIKFGMPQLIELESLEENFRLCHELELNFLELNFNLPHMQPNQLNVGELKALKDKYNIGLTAHLHEEIDLGHFNTHINLAYLNIIQDSLKLARDVGIDKLNLHMNKGIHFTLPTEKIEVYRKHKVEYLRHIKNNLNNLNHMLKDSNIELVIENTGLYNRQHICEAVEMLIASPYIHLTFDIGHNKIHQLCDEGFILQHVNQISHFHLHDATHTQDHLPFFTGAIDLKPYLDIALKNNASCLIEVKTKDALIKSVEAI